MSYGPAFITPEVLFLNRRVPGLNVSLEDQSLSLSNRLILEPEKSISGAEFIRNQSTITLSTLMSLFEIGFATAKQGFCSRTDREYSSLFGESAPIQNKRLEFLGEAVYSLICDREVNRSAWLADVVVHNVERPKTPSPGQGYAWVHYIKSAGFKEEARGFDISANTLKFHPYTVTIGLWVPPEGFVIPDNNGDLFHSITGTPLKTTNRGNFYARDCWEKAGYGPSQVLLHSDHVPYFKPRCVGFDKPLTGVRMDIFKDGQLDSRGDSVRISFEDNPHSHSAWAGIFRISERVE